MSDELECFRKAAELGCEFFRRAESEVLFKDIRGKNWLFLTPARTRGQTRRRFNTYAAAVCECWWRANGVRFTHPNTPLIMAEQARAFGKKYGAE